ncbi:MAG: zinc-finger domain-containing protein [Rickettsiales bacterium]|nr:zinc-finger domain-containing protein [Rickettsiales bacterium]
MNHQINSKNTPLEILHVNSKKVSCQGEKAKGEKGDLANVSGHPLVYLDMGKNDFVICPYCSKYFTIKQKTAANSVIIGIKNQIKDE